jgi:hypothetical protein
MSGRFGGFGRKAEFARPVQGSPMKRILISCLAAALAACGGSNGQDRAVQGPNPAFLYGTWTSVSLDVRMPTVGGADSTATLSAREADWSRRLGIGPIHTIFHPDNRYEARYFDTLGAVTRRGSGYWELRPGDSLILHRLEPSPETLRHAWVRKNDSVVGFSGLVDFDRDGETDDALYALNRRIAR